MSGRGTTLGRFVLGDRIAVGGMGEVYVATQKSLAGFEKPLALKLLLPHLADEPQAVEMFLHEARVSARASHPNVVQIFDVGAEGDRYFIAMELVRGVAVSALLRALKAQGLHLAPELFYVLARGLCLGLHHAHHLVGEDGKPLDLVHRDVSPQNVLVSIEGEVKLADFGISKARGFSSATRQGSLKGKLEYLPPEQLLGQPLDARADLFSAALTLFHLATLKSPFLRDSEGATLCALERDPLPDLAALRPDLSPRAVAAITQCASKRPEQRLQTAMELADAFPPSSGEATKALGLLVRECCASDVEALEHKTKLHLSRAPMTVDLGIEAPEATVQVAAVTAAKSSPGKGRGASTRTVALVALLSAALAGVAVFGVVKLAQRSGADSTESASSETGPIEAAHAAESLPAPTPPAEVARPRDDGAAGNATPAAQPEHHTPEPNRRNAASSPLPASKRRLPAAQTVATNTVSGVGYVSIDAQPWAHVVIDGKEVGDTPLASYPVTGREVTVVLSNSETHRTVKRKVKVVPGKRVYVSEDLR